MRNAKYSRVPVDADGGRYRTQRNRGSCAMFFRLIMFHILNILLAGAGHLTVTIGFVLGVCLIPFCCVGLVVIRITLYLVGVLAEYDASLYNFVSTDDDYIYPVVPHEAESFSLSGLRLAPDLSSFSMEAFFVAFYLYAIKTVMASLSTISLALLMALPIVLADRNAYRDVSTLELVLISIALTLVGVGFMRFSAYLSRSATRFFCCEKFAIHSYATPSEPIYHAVKDQV
ncbi:hypothetical protein Poli38472_002830 [Pythium oligandrum]|uniref:Transmembrane protein n=1 Tax=Pythium oligandrum TaxID=41045 RepID=A0A8K1C5P2_PYTOL|nr:hypothetical protein Poli38472_002830 [Pythium oligandrum]|eukprot:TMW56905.1 hypothetical protein Poli38472_002830 [Pythium oligandrum]